MDEISRMNAVRYITVAVSALLKKQYELTSWGPGNVLSHKKISVKKHWTKHTVEIYISAAMYVISGWRSFSF